nr:serine/arginine repetitive matrix protein 1-like [Aegilops tauschii subsp. strangulata]
MSGTVDGELLRRDVHAAGDLARGSSRMSGTRGWTREDGSIRLPAGPGANGGEGAAAIHGCACRTGATGPKPSQPAQPSRTAFLRPSRRPPPPRHRRHRCVLRGHRAPPPLPCPASTPRLRLKYRAPRAPRRLEPPPPSHLAPPPQIPPPPLQSRAALPRLAAASAAPRSHCLHR